jgi:hypothetical protein
LPLDLERGAVVDGSRLSYAQFADAGERFLSDKVAGGE